ncbi:uncharacterized protein LOC110271060 [Arachis ipaensis]|uniref:uncharacterized protein LOC110271060 n=1 Tax=Arachis ipaensis TaxID=130454 RepID=UPI000A2B7164|nr:uncharacterized protein LOC110271060 [Arachis ipaensis]
MARKGLYKKKPKLGPGCQQSQMALPPASASHCDESQTLPDSGDSVPATSRPFLLPRNVSMPAPQTSTNSVQNSESGHVNLAANANDVDSLDQEADDPFVEIIDTQIRYYTWLIDFDGTIKPAKLRVREAGMA